MALTPLVFGAVLALCGLYVVSSPRLQGFRDVGLITQEEPDAGERLIAYVIGGILTAIGLTFLYLGTRF